MGERPGSAGQIGWAGWGKGKRHTGLSTWATIAQVAYPTIGKAVLGSQLAGRGVGDFYLVGMETCSRSEKIISEAQAQEKQCPASRLIRREGQRLGIVTKAMTVIGGSPNAHG